MIKILLLLIILSSCSTIDEKSFKIYNENVVKNMDTLEATIIKLHDVTKSSFFLQVVENNREVVDIQFEREEAYVYNYTEDAPIYIKIKQLYDEIIVLNNLYKSYTNLLYQIAAFNTDYRPFAVEFNDTVNSVSAKFEYDNSKQATAVLSTIIHGVGERVSKVKRNKMLKELIINSSPFLLELIDSYLTTIDNLEFITYTSYNSSFFYLEDKLFNTGVIKDRQQLANSIDLLNYNYMNGLKELKVLRANVEKLKLVETTLQEAMKTNAKKEFIDIITLNYSLYNELK